MARSTSRAWELARRQHGAIAHHQLRELGFTGDAIDHRLRTRRLHRRMRGVYAVGRPELGRLGELMVAVLAAGAGALVSHVAAAALWGLVPRPGGPIDVICPRQRRSRDGLRVHRRLRMEPADARILLGVPVTAPARTLVDIAPLRSVAGLERAVNMADSLDLIDPDALRAECERFKGQPGVRKLRELLDRRTFRATDSRLEQRFLQLVRRASLAPPETQRHESGFRVDFVWPALGLVVETDSLRYHRTPSAQYRDARRDQAHFMAGRERLRFTHAQVFFEADTVAEALDEAHRRLG